MPSVTVSALIPSGNTDSHQLPGCGSTHMPLNGTATIYTITCECQAFFFFIIPHTLSHLIFITPLQGRHEGIFLILKTRKMKLCLSGVSKKQIPSWDSNLKDLIREDACMRVHRRRDGVLEEVPDHEPDLPLGEGWGGGSIPEPCSV